MIGEADRARLVALAEADGQEFTRLVAVAGLDPATSFRGADLRGVDFAGSDLGGFDFSHADLTGASFRGAIIDGMKTDRAIMIGVRWPVRRSAVAAASGRIPLRPAQREAVAAMLRDIAKRGRAVALMPNGFGRRGVLTEVIAEEFRQAVHRALLITGSAAERDIMVEQLRKRLPHVPVGTLKEARTGSFSDGLLVHNQVGIGGSLTTQLSGTAWAKSVEAVFATSTERLPLVLNAPMIRPDVRIAAVDTPLREVDRPDRHRQLGRIVKIFGQASFVLSVEQLIEQGELAAVRVIDSFAVEQDPSLRRAYPFIEKQIDEDELRWRLRPSLDAMENARRIVGFDTALVLCGDDRQARTACRMLRELDESPLVRVVGQRWSAARIAGEIEGERGLLLAPVTQQSIDAAARVSCVVVMTDLKLDYVQHIAFRQSDLVDWLQPVVLDLANAFRDFPELAWDVDEVLTPGSPR